MLDTNVTLDNDSQPSENPRGNNHDDTAPISQVILGYDSLKYEYNNTTPSTGQKIPPYGKEYIIFQTDRENSQAAQCENHGH